MYVGIRYTGHEYEIGEEITHQSNVWIDNEMTDEKLNGICTIGIADDYDEETRELSLCVPIDDVWEHKIDSDVVKEIAKKQDVYYRKHAYLIVGESMEYGEDGDDLGNYHEWILSDNCKVIAKLW